MEQTWPDYMDLLFEGKIQDAYDLCIDEISKNPDNKLEHQWYLSKILTDLGRFEEAESVLEGFFAQTNDHKALHNWASIKRMRGKLQEALEMFEKELDLIEENDILALSINQYELAKVNMMLDHENGFEEAIKCFLMSQKCDDLIMQACAYRLLGDAFYQFSSQISESFYNQAIEIFSKADENAGIDDVKMRINLIREGKNPKYV